MTSVIVDNDDGIVESTKNESLIGQYRTPSNTLFFKVCLFFIVAHNFGTIVAFIPTTKSSGMGNKALYNLSVFLLIPIIFVSMSLNFPHNIGTGCLLSETECMLKCAPAMYHSVTSQDKTNSHNSMVSPFAPSVVESMLFLSGERVDSPVTIVSNSLSGARPLRC
jgi:hypothetical protein